MPEISVIIVEPYHIQVWMKITTPRVTDLFSSRLIGSSMMPSCIRMSLTGPKGYPKRALNKMAMVAAVMTLGI